MVSFTFWHIPTPHSKTCPCTSPSTGGGTIFTIIYSTFTSNISSSIISAPPNLLFSTTITCCHCSPSSQAISPEDSTIESRVTSPAANSLHLFDHDSEPEHEIDPFHFPVAGPDSDYETAVGLWSPSPPLPVHGQLTRAQPREQPREQPRG